MTYKELGDFLINWVTKNFCILSNTIRAEGSNCPVTLSLGDFHIIGGSIFILLLVILIYFILLGIPHFLSNIIKGIPDFISDIIKGISYVSSGMIYTLGCIVGILPSIIYSLFKIFKLNDNKFFKLFNNLIFRMRPIYYAITFTAKRADINDKQLSSKEIKELNFEYKAYNIGIIIEGLVFLFLLFLVSLSIFY